MLRNSGGSGGESAARAVNRSLIAAVAIALLSSVCFAQLAIGPSLAPGQTLHGRFEQARNLKGITSTLKSEWHLRPGSRQRSHLAHRRSDPNDHGNYSGRNPADRQR